MRWAASDQAAFPPLPFPSFPLSVWSVPHLLFSPWRASSSVPLTLFIFLFIPLGLRLWPSSASYQTWWDRSMGAMRPWLFLGWRKKLLCWNHHSSDGDTCSEGCLVNLKPQPQCAVFRQRPAGWKKGCPKPPWQLIKSTLRSSSIFIVSEENITHRHAHTHAEFLCVLFPIPVSFGCYVIISAESSIL